MIRAPVPDHEVDRIRALHSYGILDTPAEAAFDDLTLLAASISQQPISLISLVDSSRQWFKSRFGISLHETSRDHSFCAHAILETGPFIIHDASVDSRFANNPLVVGEPRIRFYAGFPLINSEGFELGTLCVLGPEPSTMTDDQIEAMYRLARQTSAQLELKRTASRLLEALRQVDSASQSIRRLEDMRGRFLASASHEMLTPLNAVIGLSELLSSSGLTADQKLMCQSIQRGGEHLQMLFNGMLDLAAFESGQVTLAREDLDLRTEVSKVFNILDALARTHSVSLTLNEAPAATTSRQGDPLRIRQILTHLIEHAIKSGEHNRVEVKISDLEAVSSRAGVLVEVRGDGSRLKVQASVSSKIIPSQHQPGTNFTIGLAVTKRLVRAMTGILKLIPAPSGAVTYSLELPLGKWARMTASSDEAPAGNVNGLRVLVVDDNEVNRMVLVRVLKKLSCVPLTACDGAQAVAVNPADYDFVFMDCQMPVMDGFAATAAIRQREAGLGLTRTPIVAVTASMTAQELLSCGDQGMDGFLTKPINSERVKAMLLKNRPYAETPRVSVG